MQIENIPKIQEFLLCSDAERKKIISSLHNIRHYLIDTGYVSATDKSNFTFALQILDAIYHNSKE